MIPAGHYRHARESGHPGRAGTAFAALGPRFRGATEEEELGTICLVHTTGLSVCLRLLGALSTETLPDRPRPLEQDRMKWKQRFLLSFPRMVWAEDVRVDPICSYLIYVFSDKD